MRLFLLLGLFLVCFAPRPAAAQDFGLPIACALGGDCLIQNYVDANPTVGAAQDPLCGPLTYDGHDGLDFRAPAPLAARGVAVLAPAAGVVRFVRDGEADGAFASGGVAALNGRDCGNGLRIDHAGGWSTQLCHLRRGSLRVAAGDQVAAGQEVGLVGLSGRTEFPHVHMSLRRNDVELDPLTGRALSEISACGSSAAAPGAHWSAAARAQLSYRSAVWFAAGFTGAAPANAARLDSTPANAARSADALVFWAIVSGPLQGDVLRLRIYGPDGALVGDTSHTQTRAQAQYSLFTGRRTPAGGWPAGAYRGEAVLERGGRVVSTRSESLQLR